MDNYPNFVLVTDPDDVDCGRYGRVKDRNGEAVVLYLLHFYTGEGEPRAWHFADQFNAIDEIPPTALFSSAKVPH